MQERLIFPRDMPGVRDAGKAVPTDWEQMTVAASDGTMVPAWLRMPVVQNLAPAKVPLVVFFHGNAEVIDDIAVQDPAVSIYAPWGYAVLLIEYRGYGRAYGVDGGPTQKGIVADSVQLIDLATARADIDGDRMVYYGRSLGGGVACAVAAERPPSAIILQSTFRSMTAMAGRYLVPSFLVRHPFRSEKFLAGFGGPVLLFHGTRDDIVPCSHSESLQTTCPHARLVTQACGHNDFPADFDAYEREIKAFLDSLPPTKP